MGKAIDGNSTIGFRVVDDKIGPLTGRVATEDAAWDIAGGKPAAKGRASKAVTVSEPEQVEVVEDDK